MRRLVLLALGSSLVIASGCAPRPRAYVGASLTGEWTVALLPLTNFTTNRDAADRVGPLLQVELANRPGIRAVDPGRVEEALAREPWVLTDRLPPDVVDSLGAALEANALLVGSVLEFSYRPDDGGGQVPEISISLQLIQAPGAKTLWSAVHHRDGGDRESVFGFGRVEGLESLAAETVREIMETFPPVIPEESRKYPGWKGGEQ